MGCLGGTGPGQLFEGAPGKQVVVSAFWQDTDTDTQTTHGHTRVCTMLKSQTTDTF